MPYYIIIFSQLDVLFQVQYNNEKISINIQNKTQEQTGDIQFKQCSKMKNNSDIYFQTHMGMLKATYNIVE